MSFEILDDFQDPVKGGIYGFVNTVFINHTVQDEETPITDSRWHHEFPTSPIKFDKHNHVLQWMVTKRVMYIDTYILIFIIRSSMSELDCFSIQLLVNWFPINGRHMPCLYS